MQDKYYKSIFYIFIAWAVVFFAHATWSVITSEYRVHIVGEKLIVFFLWFYLMLSVKFSIGIFLSWFADKGKLWALWLFTIYCLYQAFDIVWAMKMHTEITGRSLGVGYLAKGLLFFAVWCGLFIYAWYSRPNKALNSQPSAAGTPQSGAH